MWQIFLWYPSYRLKMLLLCGLSFSFSSSSSSSQFSVIASTLYNFPPPSSLNVKMRLHLFNIVRVPLWLPSKADQMVTLNISKVIMLMLNCWYLVFSKMYSRYTCYFWFIIYDLQLFLLNRTYYHIEISVCMSNAEVWVKYVLVTVVTTEWCNSSTHSHMYTVFIVAQVSSCVSRGLAQGGGVKTVSDQNQLDRLFCLSGCIFLHGLILHQD